MSTSAGSKPSNLPRGFLDAGNRAKAGALAEPVFSKQTGVPWPALEHSSESPSASRSANAGVEA